MNLLDEKQRLLIANERAKLLANSLDRASTACVTIGILAPAAAFLYGVGSIPGASVPIIIGSVFTWLGAAIELHVLARTVLGSLR